VVFVRARRRRLPFFRNVGVPGSRGKWVSF
jgi:hypothetical protein